MKFVYSFLTIAVLSALFVISGYGQETPAATPAAYASPQSFQASALQWIAVATTVGTALTAFVAFVILKIGEIKRSIQTQREELGGRLDRTDSRLTGQQGQISIALANMPPPGVPVAPSAPQEPQKPGTGLVGLAIALLAALSLFGCATNSGNTAKDAKARATNQALTEASSVLGKVAVQTLFNVASQEASGKGVDFQQAAASGLWGNVNAVDTGASVARIVDAYSGNKMTLTAVQAKQTFDEAAQGEGWINAANVNAIATVISAAAGAPPAK